MKDNISPEEKLLRLIKGQKQKPPAADIDKKPSTLATDTKPRIRRHSYSFISKYLYTLNIQKIIQAAFVVSCIYLIISFIYPWWGLRKIGLPKIIPEGITESKTEPRQEPEPNEFYLEGIRGRQIFKGKSASAPETEQPLSIAKVDLTNDMSLVGIISGENPQAIIEDKKTQKTYYVTKGQFIGELQVEDIREGRITLNHQGQRYELYL